MAIKPIEILIRAKDEFSGMLGSMQTKIAAVAVAIAGFFGISLFAGAVKSAAEFEAAMSKVQAATGASGAELEALKVAAEQAGATTKFTGVQAAEALENLAKAGLSGKEAIAALPAVMAMAQAGGVSLADASERLTGVVMGMGLQFGESARVADVLAMGANASRTSIAGLAEAMSYAAPTAKTMGLSLESTTAIVAQFANAGIDASRAGTALNSILAQFSDPASKFRSELTALGITTTNFDEALKQLAATGPKGAAAVRAVGQEAGPALQSALNLGIPALEALRAKLHDAAGSAKATADVMGNNLNGALTGLSSAWQAVTTVLGTPVLPVLKSAVEQLANALRSAVADGTVQKFGEALAAAFESGTTWARAFLATIDFGKLTADLRDFADRTGAAFAQVGEYAVNAGNIVKLVYGVMSAGTNTVMGAIYGIGSAFAGVASKIQSGLALIYDGFAKVTFGDVSKAYKLAADEIRLSAEATWAVSEALGAKSTAAFVAVADGAQLARDGFAELASGAAQAGPPLNAAAAAAENLAERTAKVNADVAVMRQEYAALIASGNLEAAAAKTREIDAALASLSTTLPAVSAEQNKKSSADSTAALAAEQHRAAIAQLRAEYAALVASGDWQGAAEKLQQINAALRGAGPAAQDAAQAAKALADAYTNLGVTSSTALANLASKAKTDFELIKNSGTASAADIGAAFASAAEKAIAANNGLAPSWVKAEAAALGYKIEVDAAGKETLKLVNASHSAAQALQTLGIDVGAVSTKISSGFKESADAVTALQNNFGALGAQGVKATEAITLGLNKMLSEAKNQADLDALKNKVEELRGVLGNTVANGFLEQAAKKADELKAAMDEATPGINSVSEAMKTLGIKSEEELDDIAAKAKEAFDVIRASGTASPREINEAWKAMAEAAIAANGGVADATIQAQASAHGFAIEVDAAGKSSVKSLEDVKEGFEEVDYAAQMAGKSVEELQKIQAQGWHVSDDIAESARIQNAAADAMTNAWRAAAVEADKYYSELYEIFIKHQQMGVAPDPWAFADSIWKASAALQELDKQQQAIERSSDDAASGLAGLKDKLLELSGSEEEVAARRKARDEAEIQKKMALLKIDLQRAQIRKNLEEVAQLEDELKLYRQQLVLLDQIAKKEKDLRDEAKRKQEEEDKARKKQEAQDEIDRQVQQRKADQDRKLQQQKADQDRDGSGSGGSGGSASITAAPPPPASHTYVSNITLPSGRKETMRFADAQSQSANERLLRDLAAGKGVAQ